MSGYARIHRSLLGHTAFRNDAEAMAFAWLVIRSQWRACRVRYKDRQISLRRGQVAVSVRDFAAAMDRDKAWIERLLKRLKSETMIETVSETGVLVVTICNYDEYQAERETGETARETRGETDARQARDTEQEREESKKEPNGSSIERASARGRNQVQDFKLPDDIPVDAWAAFEQMRRATRKPLTNHARHLAVKRLRKLADDGFPPGEVLNHSVLNNYQGLFPPKDANHEHRRFDRPNATRNGDADGARGHRPNPALDLWRAGIAGAEADDEDPGEDHGTGGRAWPALPAGGQR